MSDNDRNNWSDSDRDSAPRGRKGDPKMSPPTIPSILVWVIVIATLAILLWLFKSQEVRTSLTEARFVQALNEKRIQELTIKYKGGSSTVQIVGKYTPAMNNANQAEFQSEVTLTEDLHKRISNNVPEYRSQEDSNLFLQIVVSMLPILLIVFILYVLFARQIKNAGKGAIQFGKSRARMVQSLEKVTFGDVAGVDEAKEEVEEIIDYLKDPEKFHRLGGRIPKGVLLVGPPGTGKTLLARAIAGEADVPFFNISGSDFVEMFVGVGASRVRDMFEQGKKNAPCIIFIDEIDAVGRSRFSGMGGGHDEREQTLNALLVEMDGFEGKSGVIVVAATNRADVLDPALLRPGRFDRQVSVDLPDLTGRLAILKVHSKKVKISDNVDFSVVARGTPGFSGADLANLINEAALLAARANKQSVGMLDMEEARDKVRWGKERRNRVIDEHDRRVTAFHEAGHALVGLHCANSEPLHKITIIPRGNAYLGAAMYLPHHDKFNFTKGELEDKLCVAMGGRVAEEMIFGEVTSGASMDIRQASSIARKMVCEWGMSDKIGMLSYGDRQNSMGMMGPQSAGADYSEETAREIDMEIRRISETAVKRTTDILTTHKDQLLLLGNTLLEKETMDVREVRELLGLVDDSDDGETPPEDVKPTPPSGPTPAAPSRSPEPLTPPGISPSPAMRTPLNGQWD